MTIAIRKEQIIRIKKASFQSELNEALEKRIRDRVVATVKTIIEAALVEELEADLAGWSGSKPRRSGYFSRILDTLYGRILELFVPKLRWGNKDREWKILKRYQRGLTSLLDWISYLYVMGLSLRDLQTRTFVPQQYLDGQGGEPRDHTGKRFACYADDVGAVICSQPLASFLRGRQLVLFILYIYHPSP
jgi:hypothetical protein